MSQSSSKVTETRLLIGMTEPTCHTPQEVVRSPLLITVISNFLRELQKHDSPLLAIAALAGEAGTDEPDRSAARVAELLRLLLDTPYETVSQMPQMSRVLNERKLLADFVERLYDYWRTRERYLIFESAAESSRDRALEGHTSFINAHEQLKDSVLEAYRRVEANIRGYWPRVYRQVPAGANMGLLVEQIGWHCLSGPYDILQHIRLVRLALLEPPVVLYPQRNVRQGRFVEVKENPLQGVSIDPGEWLCIPVKVGPLVMNIYFHEDYISLAISLINLFELAGHNEVRCKPDGILVFGVPPEKLGEQQTVFYEDAENDLLLGVIGHTPDVDYFGYFKKMTLTLHNLIMMRRGRLPFHGAMCRIELKSRATANIVIIGDSGAGKSETLEAFRVLAEEHLRSLSIIADDMGSIELAPDGKILGYGTEIGAFVRLDDLQPGYAFGQIDRSILMNPHRTNARLVIPVTSYEEVIAGYPVDLLLYANNFEQVSDDTPPLQLFDSQEDALHVFREGYRAAKGTSDEVGLVHTYFGNPFGPAQRKELHDRLARQYFVAMFDAGVKVGQLRTRLGIAGFEQEGPMAAARALFEWISVKLDSK